MRSTSYVQLDDYVCEVRGHSVLESLEPARGKSRGVPSAQDPESSPQEHSAAHPTRCIPVPPCDER